MNWKLERPRAALPHSYFWTWDHSTNWVLDDPGLQYDGCYNKYLKKPETFVEDYRRLIDLAEALAIEGIVIWGFLRDSHGGVECARRVAEYAASKGIAILPGVGTTWYGGVYYEGDHPCCLRSFLRKYPDARMLGKDGVPVTHRGEFGACPVHPAYHDWLRDSLAWLCRDFPIRGVNLENGDWLVDYHPLTQAARRNWPAGDPEPFFFQGLSYEQALAAIPGGLKEFLPTYATYTGFGYGEVAAQNTGMGKNPPAMLKRLPLESIAQWTITGMLLKNPLPLTSYLDDGAPAAAFANGNWPSQLRPCCHRSVGFAHQGSQWLGNRYCCVVSSIKEACLRAYRSGLEGVSIHGEVTARYVPAALNYLAFSHFTHWPEDSLRQFGRKTLGQVLASERDGEDFAEILAHWDAATCSEDHLRRAKQAAHDSYAGHLNAAGGDEARFQRNELWTWLHSMASAKRGRDYVEPFRL